MKSNFEFLNQYWPALAQVGANAESYLYSDPNACIYKLGMFSERLILEIFAFEQITEPTYDNTHANRIRLLKREGLIPKKLMIFYMHFVKAETMRCISIQIRKIQQKCYFP